jgi:asparagine synthase (glutamine-hydrolysing)
MYLETMKRPGWGMPGIVGIVDYSEDSALVGQHIKHMMGILNHTSPSDMEICILDEAALGVVRLKIYPFHNLVTEDKHNVIVFWGYLWDEEDLKKRTGLWFGSLKDISVAELLMELYRKEVFKGLLNLNGIFTIALWDKEEKVLRLISDRYGFCKLFYWVSSERILFASEYKAIIWHEGFSKEIDEMALTNFMTLGYSLEDKTFLKNIRLLPQATVATFERGGRLTMEKYWDYTFHSEEDPVWGEEAYIDQFAEILMRATERQIDSSEAIGLALSGGYDSRTLAGILQKSHFKSRIKTFSYGHSFACDVKYGKEIARTLGFKHSYLPIESTYLREYAEKFVWLMEGTVNCLNAHMLVTYPFIQENSVNTIMSGFLGDNLCGSGKRYIKTVIGRTDDEAIIRGIYENQTDLMKEEDTALYMKRDIYEKNKAKTFEMIRTRYFQCPTKNRYYRSRYFGMHERQRRYTSFNLYVFDFVAKVASPFLNLEFVEFIHHVPPVLLIFQNLYRKMIVKHLPKVASIPNNVTRLPLNASWIKKGLHWRWERLNRNLIVRATIGRRYVKMNDNYLNTDIAIRTGSRDFVMKHIKDNDFLAAYFNMDRVHQMLDGHLSGKSNEYAKITALLTLSLWHKLFVENEKPAFGER